MEAFNQIYKLRQNDYSCYDKVTPYAILDLCQDVASKHVISFNLDYETMLNQNLLWVLCRMRYQLINPFPLYADVKVYTKPKEKGLVDFDREYLIVDAKDENKIYVKAISKWVIIDKESRRIIPAKKISYNLPIDGPFNFKKIDKLKDFDIDKDTNKYEYKIEFNDLDHNFHVNNIRYAYMISNALNNNDDIIDYQIDYLHEIHKDEKVDIYYKKIDNIYYVKGIVNNTISFIANIITK